MRHYYYSLHIADCSTRLNCYTHNVSAALISNLLQGLFNTMIHPKQDQIGYYCPVGWGCRIHQLHLCRGVIPPPHECPGYDTKQSDGEVPAMLELWGM